MTILSPIPAERQDKRGWKLKLDGQPVDSVGHLELTSKFGTLEYGATPQGYDAWCFEEAGGGGSVIVPFLLKLHNLFIGLVEQPRYTMGGPVWNLPRGFLKPDETHFETAQREAGEEFRFNLAERFQELPGKPTNPNSAFFVTLGVDKGVRFYSLFIREDEVEPAGAPGAWKLRSDVLKPVSKTGEQISGSTFVSWDNALRVSDMFTLAGIGRLLPTVYSKIE